MTKLIPKKIVRISKNPTKVVVVFFVDGGASFIIFTAYWKMN